MTNDIILFNHGSQRERVYMASGVSPTICHGTDGGYNLQPKILIEYD